MADGPDSAPTPVPRMDAPPSALSEADGPTLLRDGSDASGALSTLAGRPSDAAIPGPRIPERLGPYALLGELGRGGMGIVFRARHVTLGTESAVKVLVAGEHASAESIARFHREAASVARLGKHPNIVTVFDLGWEGPLAYYAMELIDGRSLRQVLRERLFDAREAAGLLERVARALHFAHAHGVVHRDIKPNNIILRADGEPQIVDFGLAREVGSVQQWSVVGDVMGTPEYMSPEQASGLVDQTDARTDVYAVGAVLYECLVGIPPHRGETWPELLHEILEGDVVPPGKLRHGIPRDLETICLKCLETRRGARYATAEALADDLARFRDGEPVHARPISTLTRLRRRVARNWRVVLPTSVAVVLALAIGAWALALLTHDAGAVANALEMGRKYRAEDRPREARDLFLQARGIDPDNTEANEGIRWADSELARRDREAERSRLRAAEAEALLARSRLVIRVLARWGRLHRPLREIERWGYSALPPSEVSTRSLRAWSEVEAFMKETRDDSTSQATMLALAGWARHLSGSPDEGIAWMRRASRLDPDVPYGPLMEALVHFSRFAEAYPLPELTIGELGLEVGDAPVAPPEVAAERDQVPALLEQAKKARIFGEEGAEGFVLAIDAMAAMQKGDYRTAEDRLDDAIGRPELIAFEPGLLLARGQARYLQAKIDLALEDLREVVLARPQHAESRIILGHVLYARALSERAARKDPRPALTEAIEAFTLADTLHPGRPAALTDRASAFLVFGDFEQDSGRSPQESYDHALADLDEALKRAPGMRAVLNNRGNAHARMAELLDQQGKDPRDEYHLALADLDAAVAAGYAFARSNRGKVHADLARAELAHGGDPEPHWRAAVEDFDAALLHRPDHPTVLAARALVDFDRAEAETRAGIDPRARYRLVIEGLRAVIAGQPSFVVARFNLAQAWSRLADWEVDHDGDFRTPYSNALAEFGEMVRVAPDDPTAYKGRGLAHLSLGKNLFLCGEEAEDHVVRGIADLEEALRRGAGTLSTHVHLGNARGLLARILQTGRRDPEEALRGSIRSFDEAVRIAPDVVAHRIARGEVRSILAAVLAAHGEDARDAARGAIEDLDATLRANPKDDDALLRRGMMRLTIASRDIEEGLAPEETLHAAVEDLAECVRRCPDHVEARLRYIDALRRSAMVEMALDRDGLSLLERALEQGDAILRLEPGNLQLLVLRSGLLQSVARLRMQGGQKARELLDRSLADAQEAVRLAPDAAIAHMIVGDAWHGLARASSLEGEVDREACARALESYGRALELDSSLREVEAGRGAVYELLGDQEEARKAYERAKERR